MMYQSRLVKGFVLGLSMAVMFSTAAFAETAEKDVKIQIEQVKGVSDSVTAPDAPVSSDIQPAEPAGGGTNGSSGVSVGSVGSAEPALAVNPVSEAMYLKQSEIDKYLFEEHKDEIAAKGFTVTNTSSTNEYVEIGISPFNEESAEYLYQVLGKDQIKVVEGIQAVTFDTGATSGEGEEIYTAELYSGDAKVVSAPNDAQIVSATTEADSAPANTASPATLIYGITAAVIVLMGGTLLFTRRMKAARR
jgi:hypothetical protein